MMLRSLLLALAAPLAMHAQLTMLIVTTTANGPVEAPAGSVYTFAPVAVGDSADARFRARNISNAGVTLIAISPLGPPPNGSGFQVQFVPSTPYTIAPGNFLDIYVHFAAGAVGNYSGTLQISTQTASWSVSLQGSAIPGPVVTVGSPCSGLDTGTISFGRVQVGGVVNCTLAVYNPTPLSLALSPIKLTGAAFSIVAPLSVTVDTGQSVSFPMKFTAATASAAAGSLTVGTRTYSLTGTGFNALLSTPILSFDTPTVASNEQHTLTIRLPQPSPVAASGFVNLAFAPTVTAVPNDSAVQFVATSKRVLSFTVGQGSTAVLLNNQASAVFSTGTTAGRITFTVDAGAFGLAGDPTTTLIVAPLPIAIQSASGTRRANDLDITVLGFDNTYTAGAMSFTFYDTAGATIGQAIPANFSQAFVAFYQGQQSGSSFLMRVTFPVTGNASSIGSVDVTLANSAGGAHTQRLNFP